MTTLYVAGPMRGVKHYNFPAFLDAAERLREAGYATINPAQRDMDNGFDPVKTDLTGNEDLSHLGFDLRKALSWDLQQIAEKCDGIAVLPGWMNSKGATAEVALADALGLETASVPSWIKQAERGLA